MSDPHGTGAAWCPPATPCTAGCPVHAAVVLPADPASPARARQVLRRVLTEAGRLDCLDAAELACTELVTNAVLHAHTPIEVTVDVTDTVRVGVHDESASLPWRRHRDPQTTTGRGLTLVAAITDAYGVADAGPRGKTVWFVVGGVPQQRSDDDLLAAWDAAEWDLAAPAGGAAGRAGTGAGAGAGAGTDAGPHDAPGRVDGAVRLVDLPATLWLAADSHHDVLLRELVLYAARHPELAVDLVGADHARLVLLHAVTAARAADAGPAPLPHDPAEVPAPVDLTLDLPASMAGDFTALAEALDAAERLARAGELLARPGLPEIVAVRDWACGQVVGQLAGAAPAPWPGTADRPDAGADVPPPAAPGSPGIETVRASRHGVVAADESNRIVAVSDRLAQLLGWEVDDLVGRRVVTLVPERLREAHVAGFTRHGTTGETRVLGVPLTVPVLRADGTEITCRLLIESVENGPTGRLYLAWIEPTAQEPPA